jgi:hypothetical protein
MQLTAKKLDFHRPEIGAHRTGKETATVEVDSSRNEL